jgi:hypothetical protein
MPWATHKFTVFRLPASADQLIAWGQYVHWADIQFDHFRKFDPDGDQVVRIGVVAH